MKLYGLIGYPLTHSFSEQYFSEIFSREQINDVIYKLFPLKNINELPALIKKIPDLNGLSVTIPYKEAIISFLDELTDEAKKIGAVNTIKILNNNSNKTHLIGYNTDVYGFQKSIKQILKPNHKKALILGTGGAARAVEYVLKQLKIDCVFVSRKEKKSKVITYPDLNAAIINSHYLIINATPLGMYPNTGSYPDIPYEHLTENHLLYDLVYNPKETIFLKNGKKRGAIIKNGLQMLELQAEKAWEIWNE